MTNTARATASNPRPSTYLDVNGAVDVDVELTIPGTVIHGCSECGSPVDTDGGRDCGHDDADVTSVLATAPRTVAGAITLAPQQYDGTLAAYGVQPDQWISGELLRAMRALPDFHDACDVLEAAALEVV